MNRKLVFWTAWNSYQSDKCLAGKPVGTVHPAQTMEWTEKRADMRYVLRNKPMDPGILKRDFGR